MKMQRNIFEEALQGIPPDIRKEADFTFSVSDKIDALLKERGMTQKEFAREMGKTQAEVSVWLSGQHNFTLRTLAKISVFFGQDIISV